MPDFPHLNLLQVLERRPFKPGTANNRRSAQTTYNIEHRQEHYDALSDAVVMLREQWQQQLQDRRDAGLPELPNQQFTPVYLKIDLGAKDLESLASFGIQIISEEENGYILGANADDFQQFANRLDQFLQQSNDKFKNSAASILEIVTDPEERLRIVLSTDLFSRKANLDQLPEITIYVLASAYLRTPDYPTQVKDETDEHYTHKVARWKSGINQWQVLKDNLAMTRQTMLENIVRGHNGEQIGPYLEFEDSFGCMLRIRGTGLLDLVYNCPFIFRIEEQDPLIAFEGTEELEQVLALEILPPVETAAKVCVIDSGIQEGHRLLAPAIDGAASHSYVPNDSDTFDKVANGGHGTRVAGAILYPFGFGALGNSYRLPFTLQNARILDNRCQLSSLLNEAQTMRDIVARYRPTRLFNLSVSRNRTDIHTHMPLWAATIDQLVWENDILFLVAAGNIDQGPGAGTIEGFLAAGRPYPNYLQEESCRITNPAQSCFSLVVGSIAHDQFNDGVRKSFGSSGQPSAFSRSGLGLWGMIKPDVVEYGGDYIYNPITGTDIANEQSISPSLVRSIRDGGPAIGRDVVGTSFSTPKVAHIAAALQTMFPDESALLYRALIAQSARIPVAGEDIIEAIRHYGYGLPDIGRATTNSAQRVTFYATGFVNPRNANLYRVRIPAEITGPGNFYNILVEITLSFKAKPRLTRKGTRSYLSAWLDWETSKAREPLEIFRDRVLAEPADPEEDEENEEAGAEMPPSMGGAAFHWAVSSRTNSGDHRYIRRQDSTLQKDWCAVPAGDLPDDFLIAVKGHKGWQRDIDQSVPYALVVSFEVQDPEINLYELIEVKNRIELEQEIRNP